MEISSQRSQSVGGEGEGFSAVLEDCFSSVSSLECKALETGRKILQLCLGRMGMLREGRGITGE